MLGPATLLALLLLEGVHGQEGTTTIQSQAYTGFPPCDAIIAANLSHTLHLPSSSLYPKLVNGTWNLNTRKTPWCYVLPSTTAELSRTVLALQAAGEGAGDWSIAVRSGGHGSGNSNNIATGVTIDLTHLNTTSYDPNTNVASISTGSRWLDAYVELEKHGVSVTGGREGVVGVGGFLLGGGNSWYTARTGFGCDGVVNFEVVLANGEIVNANATANSDLWQALKGGGSNFGIVTRFDLEAYPTGNLTLEQRFISTEYSDEFLDAFVGFTDLDEAFHNNALLSIMRYQPETGDIVMLAMEVNTANDANTTAFDEFNRLPTLMPSTKESLTLVESANNTQVEDATVNVGYTLTIANDPQVLRYAAQQHTELVADLNSTLGPQGFRTIMELQPIPAYFADIGKRKGGNMLGLGQDSRNKVLFVCGVILLSEDGANYQPIAYQKVVAFASRIQDYAKSVGSYEAFKYHNYAHPMEDVIGSYGAANVEHIRQVAKKYDPEGFFQSRVPGGFKVSRVA